VKESRAELRMRRRSFVGTAVAGLAALFAGSPFHAKHYRVPPTSTEVKVEVRISINPMAVPRRRKGGTLNG